MATVLEPGPGLAEVLATQSFDEQAVGYPQLERYAHALAKLCRELSYPLVWPVGPAAERLAGAAVIVSRGRIRPRGWTVSLRGERCPARDGQLDNAAASLRCSGSSHLAGGRRSPRLRGVRTGAGARAVAKTCCLLPFGLRPVVKPGYGVSRRRYRSAQRAGC